MSAPITGARAVPLVLAAASILTGVLIAVLSVSMVAAEGIAITVQLAVIAVLFLAAGVVVGHPALVTAGTVGLVVSVGAAVYHADAVFDLRVALVGPLVWLTHEAAMTSFELRPAVRLDSSAVIDRVAIAVTALFGTAALALLAHVAVGAAPAGGLTFRVLAAVAVVAMVVLLGVINLRRQLASTPPAGRARGRG